MRIGHGVCVPLTVGMCLSERLQDTYKNAQAFHTVLLAAGDLNGRFVKKATER